MNLSIRLITGVALLSIVVRTGNAIEDVTASNALNTFGLKFLAETGRQLAKDTNLAISPYTVWTAMSIVNEGARGNTARELERTLFIPPNGTERQSFSQSQQRLIQSLKQKYEGVTLEVLNSVFTRAEATLNPNYVQLIEQIYGVKVEALDFKNADVAANHINKVISDFTKGRLPKIVDADSVKDSFMFITSALFFKGLWDKKFDREFTRRQTFYNEQRQPIGTVDMMHTSGAFPFGAILNGKAIAVELPYIGGKLSMILVLPTGNNSLSDTLHSIAEMPIGHILDYLNTTEEETYSDDSQIVVRLPKFKLTTELLLNDLLSGVGLVDVFDQSKADLAGISQSSLFITRVQHKTEIEVDEEGTTGSSITVLETSFKSYFGPILFQGNKASMVAILPAEGVSLTTVLDHLAGTSISKLVHDLNMTREQFSATDVMVHLPRFNVSSRLGLKAILHSMGVADVFDVSYANLTAISGASLFVSGVLHQTEIEVDEEGTTGSSATVVEISDRISDVEYFKADKPFAFIVYDKVNKVMVFAGIFVTPQ